MNGYKKSDQDLTWKNCPFPGLKPFFPEDAPIFFGRSQETRELVEILSDPSVRFITVVGDSGSGKSSLVGAGLLPQLQVDTTPEGKKWIWLRFTPSERGEDPFLALAYALNEKLLTHIWHGRERDLAIQLKIPQITLAELLPHLFPEGYTQTELLLFIDQLEELFSLTYSEDRQPFADLLATAASTPQIRVVATLRADFYAQALKFPKLTEMLRGRGTFALGAPGFGALHEMITGPAKKAGLFIGRSLIDKILEDTGIEPGALPLMAFTLQELYEKGKVRQALSEDDYRTLGGVKEAIGKQAEAVAKTLGPEFNQTSSNIFRELVDVDERGVATRRRMPLKRLSKTSEIAKLVSALTNARLLVTGKGQDNEPIIQLAHESLLDSWSHLAHWIQETRDGYRLLKQMQLAAEIWNENKRRDIFLWPEERLEPVILMIKNLQPNMNDVEQGFVGPSDENSIIEEINKHTTNHNRRALIGDRLSLIGDKRPGIGVQANGLPDIKWCDVPKGIVILEDIEESFLIEPFQIAKYPITWLQYQSFLRASDGYQNMQWWQGLAERQEEPGEQYRKRDNHPAENVSWFDAVAFSRWLSMHLGYELRLPTEWEWQHATTGCNPKNIYPWGSNSELDYANTSESRLRRTVAVGLYLQGSSPVVGSLDMSGNTWEWCLNEYWNPSKDICLSGCAERAIRGGSWDLDQTWARATVRGAGYYALPSFRNSEIGFRLVRVSLSFGSVPNVDMSGSLRCDRSAPC